ncbi:MAG: hypothetical protein QOF84_6360 [Streptomyces sp.]|nr:hypothetical protein [Streptomyces sp.]
MARRVPVRLVTGLLLVAVFWPLYWTLESAWSEDVFFPLWLGCLLIADGLVLLRTGTSPMSARPLLLLALFPVSSAYWALYELANHVIGNWHYVAPARHGRLYWDVVQAVTYSTVIPALWETAELLLSLPRLRGLRGRRLEVPAAGLLPLAGVVAVVLPLVFPRQTFPLLWFAPFLLLDPLNRRAGRPSLLGQAAEGRWGTFAAVALAGPTAGFFWELWNGGAAGYHWVYTIPWFDGTPHLFRMPLAGYLGYPPFAASTYALCASLFGESIAAGPGLKTRNTPPSKGAEMFALSFSEYGDPSVLQVTEVPEPHAGPGQVRIAVRTAGVNPLDWKIRAGYLKDSFPIELPAIPGMDAAGVVDEVGEGVEEVSVGDEVFGSGNGVSAQYAVLDHVTAKPASMSWAEAAGLPAPAETSLRALDVVGPPTAGQTLLIDGAAGGVGSIAAQFAIADGVHVIGTASESNHDHLRSLGVVPTTYGPGLKERVAALAPGGVDFAFDTAGKGSVKELIEIVGDPGRVITIADFSAAQYGALVTGAGTHPQRFEALPKAAKLYEEGKLVVPIDSEFPLAEAPKAHERSEGGHVSGKIVLTVSQS